MICTACQAPIADTAHFCHRCGATAYPVASDPAGPQPYAGPANSTAQPFAAAGGYTPAPAPVLLDRVSAHLHTLGILWLIYAVLRVLKSVTAVLFMHGIFGHSHVFGPWATNDWQPFAFALWPMIWTSLAVSALGAFITAYGLLTRQPWGRILALIFGVWALIHPLLGTALGIYTLWVLAPSASGYTYSRLTTQRPTV